MIIHSLETVEQHFTVMLFVFQVYTVCSFGKFISFGLGTVRSERANAKCACFAHTGDRNIGKDIAIWKI